MKRVIIIGAGLAGLSAAVTLAEMGIGSDLISPQVSERAQSVLAEGGINAALDLMGEGDSPAQHYADTMAGGVDLADPNAVAGLTENAPALAAKLAAFGVPFQMEGGRLVQRSFGGQKKKRTLYAKSSTGKALMTAMIDEARKYEARGLLRRFAHHALWDPVIENGVCRGAVVRDERGGTLWRFTGPVLVAAGGLNGLFPGRTTGSVRNTGDAAALLFAGGAELANLEMLQYHPTTVAVPGKRLLVSEAARGEGGRLFVEKDGRPRYFMEEKYPVLGNLMPRDVVSREMALLDSQVCLDLTGLSKEIWKHRLPDLRAEIQRYLDLDPAKKPVPVSPGIHFFMGGLWVDERHRTNIPGLLAAGECACQYHGANRLGGNSLLGALYGGSVAAKTTAELAEETAGPVKTGAAPEETARPRFAERLGEILFSGLGILRDAETLTAATAALDELYGAARNGVEARRCLLGRAMLQSALARQESRGAHTRRDFPDRNDAAYRKTTVAVCRNGEIEVAFRPIPERRDSDAAP